MKPRVWIDKISYNNGNIVKLEKDQIIVLVGPNNSGKSIFLQELHTLIRDFSQPTVVIKKIEIKKNCSSLEFLEYIENNSMIQNPGSNPIYRGYNYNFSRIDAGNWWNNNGSLWGLNTIFANLLKTEQRLILTNPPANISLTREPPSHPIHFLQRDEKLEKKFSEYFNHAFGQDLIVHRNAGSEVPLYIGKTPKLKLGEDRISQNYIKELEKLDELNSQGDGMRSFVGVLLTAFITDYSIILIDEPDAFLHPPQARLLGKMLARDLPSDKQLFLATHNGDFLRGLLDTDANRLKIIKIERDEKINKIYELNKDDIKNIWEDSLLRHSNILDGIFHSQVVICESDSDCRFYSAIADSIYNIEGNISPDILFIHCGGKHRIPTAIKALKKLNVSLKVVIDFDVLNDSKPLKEIFKDLDGVWPEVEKDWTLVKKEIEQKRPKFLTKDIKKEIENIFLSTDDRVFPSDKITEIKKALKKASAWSEAKAVGKSFIPSGNATQAFERIQIKFKEKGLFVVEIGELESFVKSVGGHGPKWVSDVLTRDLNSDPELKIARDFVKNILK